MWHHFHYFQHHTDSFFCFDAATWTAIFTGLLVVVTLGLWINASKQLSKQQRNFALANRPAIRIIDPRIGIHKETLETFVSFGLRKEGTINAINFRAWAQVTCGSLIVKPPFESYSTEFLAKDMSLALIPLPLKESDKDLVADGLIPTTLRIEIQYEGIDQKPQTFEYLCKYNAQIDSFTIERMLQKKHQE